MDRLPPLAASTPQPAEQNRVETHQLTRKQRRDKKKTEREQKKAEQALNSVRTNILQNPQQLQAALPPHLKGFGTDDPGGWWQAKKIEAYVKNLKPEFVTPLVSTKKLSQKAYTAQIKKVMARELFKRSISRPEPLEQESRIREDLNRTGPDDIEIFE